MCDLRSKFTNFIYLFELLCLENMAIKQFEMWEIEVEKDLDDLVARNFERLYHSGNRANYDSVWLDIGTAIFAKYGLINVAKDDPNFEMKKNKAHYLGVSIEIYSEEKFPHELSQDRIYRFVKQYQTLPNHLPREWAAFESSERN
jgi:hypothetical protein